MATKTTIEKMWVDVREKFAGLHLKQTDFQLVRVNESIKNDLFGGIDGNGRALIAFGISVRPPGIDLESTALEYFRQQRSDKSWLMVLRLNDVGLEDVFGRLCQDLLDEAASINDEVELLALIVKRLDAWKRLFKNGYKGLLADFQIKGLIAELIALNELLSRGDRSPEDVLQAWTGPLGADQDFIFSANAIEIKAVASTAAVVKISSVAQLCVNLQIELWVYRINSANHEDEGGINLNVLVAATESCLASSSFALAILRERLIDVGYVEHEHYDSVLFLIVGLDKYSVRDDFPRLISSVIPSGVLDVSYSIALDAAAPFKFASEYANECE